MKIFDIDLRLLILIWICNLLFYFNTDDKPYGSKYLISHPLH